MTFKFTLISLNFERYKSSSRMTKCSSLQENSITNISVLKSVCASLILFALESLPVHMYCHAGYLARRPPNLFLKRFTCPSSVTFPSPCKITSARQ